jgi:glycosyltransferase involved in cell wall biosynthesis
VTSNVSSLPEVAGNAGILVDPYSVEDITHGIKKALRNKISLTQKGLKQADKYSWAKTARETLKVYKELTS